ncbi:hypothetical protein Slin15195_G061860 [Septoria linicola]|uniref:Uncharacterized protein n=1 Tax=Septoria linicola TaxID=215465 RepID=A0A9Q9ANQ8_9PEZI|nr:hypothetical protein Slin15195_G061860 [Septoria linicola]
MTLDVLESFSTTNLVLLFALTWGTVQIIIPRAWLVMDIQSAEKLTFGQVLPLLLLLQPVLAIIAHYAETPNVHGRQPPAQHSSLLPYRTPAYDTLTSCVRHCTLLTAEEKANGTFDPIKQNLLGSRAYHGLLWTFSLSSFGLAVIFAYVTLFNELTDGITHYVLLWTFAAWAGLQPDSVMFYTLFSTKLR